MRLSQLFREKEGRLKRVSSPAEKNVSLSLRQSLVRPRRRIVLFLLQERQQRIR